MKTLKTVMLAVLVVLSSVSINAQIKNKKQKQLRYLATVICVKPT
jgi:hypothetical protein